ncbi:MAG: hypothetical protein JRF65_11155 [Deltaproteobacteria bacterium]|nr:hypothetical protein [Deltaproteobacteria bacterium]MBW2285145.1 hypothetical protein [Deltaproteobacteria bacterium]
MYYLKNLWIKFRYSNRLRLLFDALARFGILVQPYYIIQEGLFGNRERRFPKGMDAYETGYLAPEDMETVAAIPGRKETVEDLRRRLEKGNLCFGAKRHGELAAFTWFGLDVLDAGRHRRPLEKDEAYLFDAYTLIPYRGKGIAPYIRYLGYEELEKLGRTRLYSISLYFNTPAVNFKKKLGAEFLELRLEVRLFRKWNRDVRVKRYGERS